MSCLPDSTSDQDKSETSQSTVVPPDSTTNEAKCKKQKRSATENLRIKLKIDMINGEVIQSFDEEKDSGEGVVKTRRSMGSKKVADVNLSDSELKPAQTTSKRIKLVRTSIVKQSETDSQVADDSEQGKVKLKRARRNISWSHELSARKRLSKEDKEVEQNKVKKTEGVEDVKTNTIEEKNIVQEKQQVMPTTAGEMVATCVKELFCWVCHKDGELIHCGSCPRGYHVRCIPVNKAPPADSNWMCSVCCIILHAENTSSRSAAMKSLTLNQLCDLLKFTLDRMKHVPQSHEFWRAVDTSEFPAYRKYISNPMDLNLLEKNIKSMMYGSTEAFLADTKWLYHNSVIFNSSQSPVTGTARLLVKVCKQEMTEIENCPDCYLNAHTLNDWFLEICRSPHLLVWARLKGFPYWPAKVMTNKPQLVDVRFFGAHDKAWISVKDCYLFSKNSPQPVSKKRHEWELAVNDVKKHISKIEAKYGSFNYAPDKTAYVPELHHKLLEEMIPNVYKLKQEGQTDACAVVETESPAKKKKTAKKRSMVNAEININSISDHNVTVSTELCPEDEIADSLEDYSQSVGVASSLPADDDDGQSDDVASAAGEDDPIPEHGYSRLSATAEDVGTTENENAEVSADGAREPCNGLPADKENTQEICSQMLQDIVDKIITQEKILKRKIKEDNSSVKKKLKQEQRVLKQKKARTKTGAKPATTAEEDTSDKSDKCSVSVKIEQTINSVVKIGNTEDKSDCVLNRELKEGKVSCDSSKTDENSKKEEVMVDESEDSAVEAEKIQTMKQLGLELTNAKNRHSLPSLSSTSKGAINKKTNSPNEPQIDKTQMKTKMTESSKSNIKETKTDKIKEPMVKVRDVESLKSFTVEQVKKKKTSPQPQNEKKPKLNEEVAIAPKRETKNGAIIVRNAGSASGASVTTNAGTKYAIQQNDLGQISLVQLSNLTTGIQTNFVNLTNETIGNKTGAAAVTTNSPILLTGVVSPQIKQKTSVNNSGKGVISVKSAASLCNPPPLVLKPGLTEVCRDSGAVSGSATSELNKHAAIISEHMKTALENILRDLGNQGCTEAKYKSLQIEIERLQWRHQQEIHDIRATSERNLNEMRKQMESEKQQALLDLKMQMESRYERLISETKKKQWCANCGNEALFYCCWNTSYCDYPCQKAHWLGHMNKCAQLGNTAPPPPSSIQTLTQRRLQHAAPANNLSITPYPFFA